MEKVLLHHLQIEADDDGLYPLMDHVEPKWKRENIIIKKMSFGNQSCHLYKCSHSSGEGNIYVVRIFEVETPMMDHKFELKVLQHIEQLQLFPKIAAIFQNGVCYHYIEGVPFYCRLPDDGRSKCVKIDDEKLRSIAERLVDIHNVNIPEEDYSRTNYFENLMSVVDTIYPEKGGIHYPDKDYMKNLVHELTSKTRALPLGPLVTCHGDFQLPNILWNDKTKKVTVIDWEMCYIGHRALDLAYFLVNLKCLVDIEGLPTALLPEDFENKLLKYYITRSCEVQGQTVLDSTVTRFFEEVKYFKIIAKLFHVCVSVSVALKFDPIPKLYIEYINNWLDEIRAGKELTFDV